MRVVLVPSTLALLPDYTSIEDPIADLRASVDAAVAWLLADGPAAVRGATPAAKRIGDELLGDYRGSGPGLLVVANGTATRTEKAPGHFDERAEGFDALVGAALRTGDFGPLADLDLDLAGELWAPDASALVALAGLVTTSAETDYDAAPYGVQYWVTRYTCAS
ncbi:MAG: hypothetical protein NTV23_07935 [Propionibacteriales bacterium]|nr:hypothetical protein [Propionibacteriales bacterium]